MFTIQGMQPFKARSYLLLLDLHLPLTDNNLAMSDADSARSLVL